MKNNYYAIITANVRYDKRLTPNAKLMYGEITALTNHKGYAWASNSYFANLYEVNNKTVSRWINQLVKYEYIKTNLIYKKGTKQVEQRQMFINDTPMDNIVEGYGQESLEGMDNIVDSPMDKKVEDSTTSTNTTFNTTSNKTVVEKLDNHTSTIIEYLNEVLGTKYKPSTAKTKSLINSRIEEGFTVEDFKEVIDKKSMEWGNDNVMKRHLVPNTLFSNKFEGYLNQVIATPSNQKPSKSQYNKDNIEQIRRELGHSEQRRSVKDVTADTKRLL